MLSSAWVERARAARGFLAALRRRAARAVAVAAVAAVVAATAACSYKIEITQGDARLVRKISEVEIGMTKTEARALLGAPQIEHIFRDNVWIYSYKRRDSGFAGVERAWAVKLTFDADDKLVEITELVDDFQIDEPTDKGDSTNEDSPSADEGSADDEASAADSPTDDEAASDEDEGSAAEAADNEDSSTDDDSGVGDGDGV